MRKGKREMTKVEMVYRALAFANEAHKKQARKGSDGEAYITHPTEVMSVMNAMGLASTDPNLVAAGLLHDVVEDETGFTLDDIREEFGDDVATLVEAHTEDKSGTWEVRKTRLIDELQTADKRVKLLVMADAMANLRNMYRDKIKYGDELWKRFNAPEDRQRWYYSSIVDAMSEFGTYDYSAVTYGEMVELLHKVFPEE